MAPAWRSSGRDITNRGLNRALLARQGLLSPLRTADVPATVAAVLSLQAQHPEWPPVALAARVTSSSAAGLRAALDAKQVVRASLMRITIHIVAVPDLRPMIAACRPMRLDQLRLLMKGDPVEGALGRRLRAAHPAAIAALRERPRAQREMEKLLVAESGVTDATLAARLVWRHFIGFVPTVHVPWDGEGYGRSRYAVLDDWLGAPDRDEPSVEDATTYLGARYLTAFGPATVADFTQYVGRTGGVRRWRAALDALGDRLVRLRGEDGRELLDLADAPRPDESTPAPPRLLARWDSALLSHEPAHRDRIIAAAHRPLVYTKNADVLPTFLADGFVAGTWSLLNAGEAARIELQPFATLSSRTRGALAQEADRVLRLALPLARDRDVGFAAPLA